MVKVKKALDPNKNFILIKIFVVSLEVLILVYNLVPVFQLLLLN